MTDYHCYLCQHKWEYSYAPQYRYVECPNCGQALIEVEARAHKDAYWNAKDEFEHEIKELFAHAISPEEFEKKWRPRLRSSNKTGEENE